VSLPLGHLVQVLIGLVVEHARGREDLLSILKNRVKQLPLLVQLARLQIDQIRGVVSARDELVRHARYVLNASRTALYQIKSIYGIGNENNFAEFVLRNSFCGIVRVFEAARRLLSNSGQCLCS
jgi:hypothetical protein